MPFFHSGILWTNLISAEQERQGKGLMFQSSAGLGVRTVLINCFIDILNCARNPLLIPLRCLQHRWVISSPSGNSLLVDGTSCSILPLFFDIKLHSHGNLCTRHSMLLPMHSTTWHIYPIPFHFCSITLCRSARSVGGDLAS
jgi:hypothetical protein